MANNEVKITVSAKDEASANLKKLAGMVDKLSLSTKAGTDFLRGMGVSLSDFASPAELAGKAVGALINVVKEGVSDFAAYGEQVESVSRKLGITAEEASKLIQVSDDLEVDYNVLTQAFKEGLKDGIIPSIEGIADLAKEYQDIEDPAKRAAFATDKFGRAGLEMQKMLETSPEKLREMGEAVELTGLLMDEEGVKAAKEYRLAVDQLQDSWDGMVARTMPAVVKGLTAVNNTISEAITFQDLVNQAKERGIKLDMKSVGQTMAYSDSVETLTAKIKAYDEQLALAQKANADFREEERGITIDTGDAEEAQMRYAETMDRRTTATLEAKTAQVDLNTVTLDAATSMQKYTEQLLFNIASQNLDAEGALQLASAMGLIDNKTVVAYGSVERLTAAFDTNNDGIVSGTENVDAYVTALAGLNRRLEEMPNDKTIDVYLNIHGDLAGIERVMNTAPGKAAGSGPIMDAVGGPMYRGETHIAGEAGYPETVVQGANGGWVYPTAPVNNNYNLTINSQARSEQVAASFALMQAMAR